MLPYVTTTRNVLTAALLLLETPCQHTCYIHDNFVINFIIQKRL